MKTLVRLVVQAAAIWLATLIVPGIDVVGGNSTLERVAIFLGVAVVFWLVNAIVKPIVKVISFPLYLLTLGLFSIVVNALMLLLVGWLSAQTEYGLRVEDFLAAALGAIVISIGVVIGSVLVPKKSSK